MPEHQNGDGALALAVTTNAYSGYELAIALDHVAALPDCDVVELDAIDGLFAHVDPAAVHAPAYREELAAMLRERDLRCAALSAQIPSIAELDDAGRSELVAKLHLASEVGARRVNVGAGPLGSEEAFLANLRTVLPVVTELGLSLGLETQGPGALVHDRSCLELLRSVPPDRVDVNYDFGNCYFARGGDLDMLEDYRTLRDHVGSLHLKDAVPSADGGWSMTPIEGHIVDYTAVFGLLAATGRQTHVAIELPLRFVLGDLEIRPEVPPLDEIDRLLSVSIDNVRSMWQAKSPS